MPDAVVKRIRDYQRELLAVCDEFFRRVTGSAPEKFHGFKDLSDENWPQFINRFNDAGQRLDNELVRLYNKHRKRQFDDAKLLGGTKLVLGGGSRFYGTQREAVSRASLYADTILVPDPVYAWLEVDRGDDATSIAFEVFKTVHSVLLLRPLIDADLETLPLVIFPSFEKTFERDDPDTQDGIRDLTTAYFNAGLKASFSTIQEVVAVARSDGDAFIESVHAAGLFVPRGDHDTPPEDIRAAIREYRDEIMEHRGPQQVELAKSLSDAELLTLAILESVGPHFHLFENSVSLAAQPFMCFPNHWYYFRTLALGAHRELSKSGLISKKTVATIEALQRERFQWMANIQPSDLVSVRESSGFIEFRKTLDSHTAALDDVQLGDIDRVGGEVASGIASLLDQHDKRMGDLVAEFDAKHKKTAIYAGAGVGLAFLPALGSVISGASAFGVLLRYVSDKMDEKKAKGELSRSLLGVLARAHDRE